MDPSTHPNSPLPKDEPFRRFAAAAAFLLVVIGASVAWQHYTSVYHLATVQPGVLYRDGARSVHELDMALAKVRPKTVVCLVDDGEISDPAKPQFKQEFELLKNRDIAMERIPVKLGGWPSSENIRQFLDLVDQPRNQPVLVHCAQGVRRTAMMAAAYQQSILGYDKQRAKDEIITFGHSDNTINDIRKFIDAYDPKTRTVSLDVAKGK